MRALDQKLLRDLGHMLGQALTIALVVACGIASYVAIKGTYYSLLYARDTYYERYRFADVFAQLERAPESLRARIEAIPGVARVQSRIVQAVSLPIESMTEPATANLVSLGPAARTVLGNIALREGRMVEPGRADEVVVLEAFARGHGLRIGDRLPAVIAGVRRELRVVGTALSPEYVFAVTPGSMSADPRRFGVLWMDRSVVSAAFHMEGAFNDLLIRLQKGASESAVIDATNRLLLPYGGFGAHGRNKQISHNVLRSELSQLETLTRLLPAIFLGVAAFLINVVLSRIVQLERGQIAALKAMGYSRREVGFHYLKLVGVIVFVGSLLGIGFGDWLGGLLTGLYTKFFHFPSLRYRLEPRLLFLSLAISLLAALLGGLGSVLAVMRLPPAEAMRPLAPSAYRLGLSDRLPIALLFGQSAQMVMRELERRPLRALLSSLGVAMAVAVLVAGRFSGDAIDWFMRVQFELAQREDLNVSLRRAVPERAVRELGHLPGVLRAEGLRALSVRYRSGPRFRENLLFGHPDGAELRRVVNRDGQLQPLPKHGLLLSSALATILEVHVGDHVSIDVLEGERGHYQLLVAGLVDEVFGLFGHMRQDELSRTLRAEPLVSVALLSVDPLRRVELERALTTRPDVLGVDRLDNAIEQFRRQTAGQMRVTTLILTIFAAIIASGVIYNNARIALSTRNRDLASLRVLGFRRGEISAILLGELAIQVLVAIIPGMLLGGVIADLMMAHSDPEMYRFPVVISTRTYVFAIVITLIASLVSALLVRHRLDHLDLIGVLKSRE